jgi:hypothetical protein
VSLGVKAGDVGASDRDRWRWKRWCCVCYIIVFGMERRPWSAEEDQILKDLFEKVKLNKWSLIARRMEEEYQMGGRSGKQCRER